MLTRTQSVDGDGLPDDCSAGEGSCADGRRGQSQSRAVETVRRGTAVIACCREAGKQGDRGSMMHGIVIRALIEVFRLIGGWL